MIIVVLGTGVDEKGRLSKETVRRLQEAYQIYKKKKTPLFLSGKYNFPYDKKNPPKITEAEVMQSYLTRLGVEEENIFVDKESEDTIFSAYTAKTKFCIPRDEKEVVVVTSDIHLERVEYVFFKVFGEDYNLHFIGTLSFLPCRVKGMIIAKQNMLTQKAREMLDNIEEGEHEKIKEIALKSDYKNKGGLGLPENLSYKKTC